MEEDGTEELCNGCNAWQSCWIFPPMLMETSANLLVDTLQFFIFPSDSSWQFSPEWLLHFMANNFIFACDSVLTKAPALTTNLLNFTKCQLFCFPSDCTQYSTVYSFPLSHCFWINFTFSNRLFWGSLQYHQEGWQAGWSTPWCFHRHPSHWMHTEDWSMPVQTERCQVTPTMMAGVTQLARHLGLSSETTDYSGPVQPDRTAGFLKRRSLPPAHQQAPTAFVTLHEKSMSPDVNSMQTATKKQWS